MAGTIATGQKVSRAWRSERGAGASPLFPPHAPTAESAREEILEVLHREPRCYGHPQSRWKLDTLRQSLPWLRVSTRAGLSQILKRLRISYKRGRDYVHSPDRAYDDKCARVARYLLRAWYAPDRFILLYEDEFTYYRQPTLARAYEATGHQQPLASRSYRSNTRFRMAAAMNPITGQVHWLQASKVGRTALIRLYQQLCEQYPKAETIYIVQDNWPVHFHPDVLAVLQPQHCPWPWPVPGNWSQAPSRDTPDMSLRIEIVPLPTYAPWLNPIEKLWGWLKADILHMHTMADEWVELRARIADFMDQFQCGTQTLLRCTGLLPS